LYVLLNGIPGSSFQCKRGVRQGDPLSPLLFVLAAHVLQSLVNEEMNNGLLIKHLTLQCSPSFPILKYVDDTFVILQAYVQQLEHVQQLLQVFGDIYGLRVNYYKSNLIPINVADDKVNHFTTAVCPSFIWCCL
jgi:hypothetical protein